jgi:acylphosphatase
MNASTNGGTARLQAIVHGRVHGVGFRYFVVTRASALDLVGWVANEAGGTLQCVAEGPRADLEQLLELLREGPAAAHVQRVDATWGQSTGEFSSFSIRSGFHAGD